MSVSRRLFVCVLAFSLASISFACLLGHFYGWWNMQWFAPCILAPSTVLLVGLALSRWGRATGLAPMVWEGALGGLFAAVIYDLFRWPFVVAGYPLFAVFPKFGQMLLYGKLLPDTDPNALSVPVQLAGWLYHFSNGMALGVMFVGLFFAFNARPSRKALFWGSAAWAVTVEVLLLLSPYYAFFKLHLDPNIFLVLTLSAHIVFGIALGWYLVKRRRRLPSFGAVRAAARDC